MVALRLPQTPEPVQSVPFWLRLQVTAVFVELLTVAVYCCVCGAGHEFPASLAYKFAAALGVTLTLTAGGGGGVEPPPQAISIPSKHKDTNNPASAEYLEILRPAKPANRMPAIGRANGHKGEREPFWACRPSCGLVPVPWFGPVDLIESVTLVAPAPAAIDAGVKVQLLLARVGSVGLKLQLKVTFPRNVLWLVGVAVKL